MGVILRQYWGHIGYILYIKNSCMSKPGNVFCLLDLCVAQVMRHATDATGSKVWVARYGPRSP